MFVNDSAIYKIHFAREKSLNCKKYSVERPVLLTIAVTCTSYNKVVASQQVVITTF